MRTTISRQRQRGASLFSIMFLVVVLGILAIAGFRIVPLYMNYLTVLQVAKDTHADGSVSNKSKREIRETLNKRFRTNNLWDFKAEEIIKIKKDPGKGVILHIDYEDRSPLIYNLEVIAKFDQTVGGQ
ncbi:MAG: DUF4845 domain-containing protein [Pseudomonadota bacterium]